MTSEFTLDIGGESACEVATKIWTPIWFSSDYALVRSLNQTKVSCNVVETCLNCYVKSDLDSSNTEQNSGTRGGSKMLCNSDHSPSRGDMDCLVEKL